MALPFRKGVGEKVFAQNIVYLCVSVHSAIGFVVRDTFYYLPNQSNFTPSRLSQNDNASHFFLRLGLENAEKRGVSVGTLIVIIRVS